ncbi:MAG: polyprenyl synthetase family protein [Christensenellales bacterium]|jgi:geranylgeranyl diphosphate synthase type II
MIEYKAQYNAYRALVETSINEMFMMRGDIPRRLQAAMRYSVDAGGKRLRPVLLLACCDLVGGDARAAMAYACAVEMIHTYSLIHDDLPAMDDSPMRRGAPSNHMVHGEAFALLAGDGLLTFAFEVMLQDAQRFQRPEAVSAMRAIAHGAGVGGMVAGQCLDLSAEQEQIHTEEELLAIHKGKTVALLVAACTAGALLGGAAKAQVAAIRAYARNIGLAFQITDDILDYIGDPQLLGKPTGGDLAHKKLTFVSLYGTKTAAEKAHGLIERAQEALSVFPGERASFLHQLAQEILMRAY